MTSALFSYLLCRRDGVNIHTITAGYIQDRIYKVNIFNVTNAVL